MISVSCLKEEQNREKKRIVEILNDYIMLEIFHGLINIKYYITELHYYSNYM